MSLHPGAGPTSRAAKSTNYDDLVALFKEWREFVKPKMMDGVPDYSADAMKEQFADLGKWRGRLAAIDPSGWTLSQRADYEIIRAEMNGLEFDHRVLRPWSRNAAFYTVVQDSPPDVPAREGPELHGTLLLFAYSFPLPEKDVSSFRAKLQAIPRILDQAKANLVEDAKDLFFLGIRVKKEESAVLGNLAKTLAKHHPDLVGDAEKAKAAVDDFRGWLEEKHKTMSAPSGIGIENYNWYMKNVHLVPYTWEEQVAILQRELERSWAFLKLEENRNRKLPELTMAASAGEYDKRRREAVKEFMDFIRNEGIFTMPDYSGAELGAGRVLARDRTGRLLSAGRVPQFAPPACATACTPSTCSGWRMKPIPSGACRCSTTSGIRGARVWPPLSRKWPCRRD